MKDGLVSMLALSMGLMPIGLAMRIADWIDVEGGPWPVILSSLVILMGFIANLFWAKMWMGHPWIAELNLKARRHFRYDDAVNDAESAQQDNETGAAKAAPLS